MRRQGFDFPQVHTNSAKIFRKILLRNSVPRQRRGLQKMKTQKGFIQIPLIIVIIAGVLVLGGAGYFGVKQYKNYQNKKITEEQQQKELQDLVSHQQDEINKLKEAELLKKCETLSSAWDRLNAGCPGNVKPKPQTTITKDDLPSIIKQWKPRVAFIDCKVVFSGNNMGEQSGSGYIWGVDAEGGYPALLTNNHVIEVAIHNLYGEPMDMTATPTSCDIKIPGDSQFVTVYNDGNTFSGSKEQDFGLVNIKTPTPYMKKITQNLWYGNCKKKAELGEKILILGYPGIGDQNDVTATDGIISGYDGNYYITSAKVEKGNSGGIAISLKNNCYLGIPTFVTRGQLESLARILDINILFPQSPPPQ